MLRSDRLASTP